MARISFAVVRKTLYQTYYDFRDGAKIKRQNRLKGKLQNTTVNLPSYIFSAHALIHLASFFIHFVELLPIVWIGKGWHCFYVPFLGNWNKRITKVWKENTDICGKYSKWLRHEIKFENRVKNKNSFFMKQNISFLFQTKIYIFLFLE